MLLERYDIREIGGGEIKGSGSGPRNAAPAQSIYARQVGAVARAGAAKEGRPLIVTKENAHRAFFYKLNRHSSGVRKGGVRLIRQDGFLRGNSFTGSRSGQRVVIKINPVKNRTKGVGVGAGSGAKNLYHHVRYISRAGAGEEGERAILFDGEQEGLDGAAFFESCADDRHHFRMIVSPENGHDIEDFQGYVRQLMVRVEKDLGSALEWVAAVHYDTDDVHAHVIIRGVNERGSDLVIARDYISWGVRGRAQEIATEILGARSLEAIQKSAEREVDALRVTSLDRFIERQVDERHIVDVRKDNNFGKSVHYEGLIKGRLKYLESSGLAIEHPPDVYTLKEDYSDILGQISQRETVLKRLRSRIDGDGLGNLSLYSLKAGAGALIEGRVVDQGIADEMTDSKYMVLRDASAMLHYVPVGVEDQYDELKQGSLVRVRPGDQSSGKADYNINLIARQNGGVYDINKHSAYIEQEMDYLPAEDHPRYLEAHRKRLDTLEKNRVVKELGEGRYQVPADVVAQGKVVTKEINALEKKRFYPRLDVLLVTPVEELTDALKKTWLDKELFKQGKGKSSLSSYDEETLAALEARKDWLVQYELGFIQSNGSFALRSGAMLKLDKLEVHETGHRLAAKAGLIFNDREVTAGAQPQFYLGCVTLETGVWGLVATDTELQMAHLEQAPDTPRGASVIFKGLGDGKFVLQEFERQQVRAQGRDEDIEKDQDQGRER